MFALVVTAALVAALEYTRFGAQVRAAVDNQRMARGLGINVDGAFAITFALGSGLAGLGGALAIEIVGLDPSFALAYLVYVLIVVAVGGLGSIGGSFAAAMLLGISDMAGKYYFPAIGAFLIYLVMLSLLMWRPVRPLRETRMTVSSAAIAGPHQHLEAQVRWRTIEIVFWLATLLPFVVTPDYLVLASQIAITRAVRALARSDPRLRRHRVARPCRVLRLRRLHGGPHLEMGLGRAAHRPARSPASRRACSAI